MLKNISPLKTQVLSNNTSLEASYKDGVCRVESLEGNFEAGVEASGTTARFTVREMKSETAFAAALDLFFGNFAELTEVLVANAAKTKNFDWFKTNDGELKISRAEFLQIPLLWHRSGGYAPTPEDWIATSGRAHPRRPKLVEGTYYRRYVPRIGKTISFRTINIEKDLDIFHKWHTTPRVFDLWDLNLPKEELRTYLEKGLADAHSIPMILEFDNQPVGYFEIYWATEDRIGPFYDASAFDRGFHFLIGEDDYLGFENTDSVLRSVAHMMFLEDARTREIVGEPRADNKRVLRYVQVVPGWKFVKEFDFPHKRAALIMCNRERYFAGNPL